MKISVIENKISLKGLQLCKMVSICSQCVQLLLITACQATAGCVM